MAQGLATHGGPRAKTSHCPLLLALGHRKQFSTGDWLHS